MENQLNIDALLQSGEKVQLSGSKAAVDQLVYELIRAGARWNREAEAIEVFA